MSELKNLINEINKQRNLYYNEKPEISDEKYDAIEEKLKKEIKNLEKTISNNLIEEATKVLNEIGKDRTDGFEKANHIMHMHSQEKVNNPKDFIKWWNKRGIESCIVQDKLDGVSIELQYKKGEFVAGITRGDGIIGDDISHNVSLMKYFKSKLIDRDFTGAIRGEIILINKIFEEIYKPQGYKNPRNMASGIAKQKEGKGCNNLFIICYDAINIFKPFKNEIEKNNWLIRNKLLTVNTKFFDNPEKVIKYWEQIGKERNKFDFNMDGLVIKNFKINLEDQKRNRPEYQIAFKWNAEEVSTKIIGIKWSRHGNNYTPVALLEPIELAGTTVKRASLVNLDEIKRLGIDVSDTVIITKRGEIIPKIERIVKKGIITSAEIFPPNICEVCKEKLEITGKRVFCPNENCSGREYKRLEKWIKKLGIKGFGPKLLSHLHENGFVTSISDFYTVDISEALNSTNLKKAMFKAFDNLYSIKEVSLATFISGLDIEGIGEGVVDLIIEAGYDTLNKIINADLGTINGIGPDRAEKLDIGLQEMESLIDELLKYIKIKKHENKKNNSLKLEGKTFCFTGKLNSIKRAEAELMVITNGGKFDKKVNKNLDYLVTNTPNSGSSKNIKAKEFGISIITEDQFLKLIQT